MKNIIGFIGRFFKLLFGENVRKELDYKFENDEISEMLKEADTEISQEKLICTNCKNVVIEKYYTGLIRITYGNGFYNSIGGLHTQDYQFHYEKCLKCGYFRMIEYRKVPTWLDDLFGRRCPFIEGDIIDYYKHGCHDMKYVSHEILKQ